MTIIFFADQNVNRLNMVNNTSLCVTASGEIILKQDTAGKKWRFQVKSHESNM